jgi:hypothetical protein
MANIRRQKNIIHELHFGDSVLTNQKEKYEAIHDHYFQQLGTYKPRTCQLNLTHLDWAPRNLHHLDNPFSDDEI